MTCGKDQPLEANVADSEALALVVIARGLAHGIHRLVPTCTAAVVVAVGSVWQLLAKEGLADVTSAWRASVADPVGDSDGLLEEATSIVAPFSTVELDAVLMLVAEPGRDIPISADRVVQPLLDGGGALLDRALAAQRRDRVLRRVVLECRVRNGDSLRTIDDLERTLPALWPGATAQFHLRDALDLAPWPVRGPLRTACDVDLPTISRTPAHDGLLPPGLAFRVAVPIASHGGALLIEAPAGGEEPDADSIATAIALTQTVGVPTPAAARVPTLGSAVSHA